MRALLRLALVLVPLLAMPALAKPRPAMSSRDASFELFGTSVCLTASCDVQLTPNLLADFKPFSETPRAKVWRFLGLTFCSEQHDTGPACDIVWTPPMSTALAWQSIRMGVLPGQ